MNHNDLTELVERMRFYEQHQHFDGYEITLAEFSREMEARPIAMTLALLSFVLPESMPSTPRGGKPVFANERMTTVRTNGEHFH